MDYGNCYRAKVEDVRQELYAHRIPVQVLRVELAVVRPLGGKDHTWPDSALDFISLHMEQKIRVEVVDSTRQPPTVNIFVSKEKFDLGKMLSSLEGDLVELG